MQWQAMLEWSAGTASRTFGQGEAARARQARAQRTHHARSPSWVRALLADNCVAIATSRRGGLITGRFAGTTQELALRQSSLSVRSLRVGEAGRASTQSYFIFRAQGITRTIIWPTLEARFFPNCPPDFEARWSNLDGKQGNRAGFVNTSVFIVITSRFAVNLEVINLIFAVFTPPCVTTVSTA